MQMASFIDAKRICLDDSRQKWQYNKWQMELQTEADGCEQSYEKVQTNMCFKY